MDLEVAGGLFAIILGSMKTLLFIRHGESEANKLEICAGHTDVVLTDLGVRQAHAAGQELRQNGTQIDTIVTSPLARAYDTAAIIAHEIGYPVGDILQTELAMERYRGNLEGKPSSLQEGMSPEEFAYMGAESEDAMGQRARALQQYLLGCDFDTVLLVSHNHFGKKFVSIYTGEEQDLTQRIPNARVIKL